LTGTVGSLISLFDAVLVSGYGSSTPAGWTKPYSDTNIGVYRTGAGSRQRYIRVDDSATTDSRIHAFETMASVSDYSTQFTSGLGTPSAGSGYALKKSITADAVVRPWVIVATESAIYTFLEPALTGAGVWATATTSTSGNGQFFFGDFISFRPGDTYNTAIIGPNATTNGSGYLGAASSAISSAAIGHYLNRSYLGFGAGGVGFNKGVPGIYYSFSVMGSASASNPFPDLITGGIQMAPVEIAEMITSNAHIIRGRMPGIWASINSLPATQGDIITGTGILAGKTLLVVQVWQTSTNGRLFIEISNTW
jgi:hypothetical protein